MEGKLDVQTLQHSLLSKLGKKNEGIIISSLIGIDACAYEYSVGQTIARAYYGTKEECFTICISDPITFPTPNPGRYAIVVNLNDLACLGAVGYGILVTWLLPTTTELSEIEKLQSKLHESALEFDLTILGGHTEFTSAVTRPIISLSMIGFTPKSYLPPRAMESGDHVYLLGNIGNEGTAILGHELLSKERISKELRKELKNIGNFEKDLSIYRDALKINKKIKPKVMHDPTEGGLLGAIYEMMIGKEIGIKIDSHKIPIENLTKMICNLLDVDPLRLISSGTLIICTDREINFDSNELEHPLREIGVITSERKLIIDNREKQQPESDQINKGLRNLQSL